MVVGGEGTDEWCISYFFYCCDKVPEKSNLKEKECLHSGFSFSLFIRLLFPGYGIMPHTFRVGLSPELVFSGNTLTDTPRDMLYYFSN
jgi:hypothetical protein